MFAVESVQAAPFIWAKLASTYLQAFTQESATLIQS